MVGPQLPPRSCGRTAMRLSATLPLCAALWASLSGSVSATAPPSNSTDGEGAALESTFDELSTPVLVLVVGGGTVLLAVVAYLMFCTKVDADAVSSAAMRSVSSRRVMPAGMEVPPAQDSPARQAQANEHGRATATFGVVPTAGTPPSRANGGQGGAARVEL